MTEHHTQTPQKLARSLLVGFALLGSVWWLVPTWRSGEWWYVPMASRLIWAIGFLLALSCYLGGPIGNGVFRFFTAAQKVIEQVLTTVCLALVYVLVLGPIAIVMRLRDRDRLKLRRPRRSGTYWQEADPTSTAQDCERQF